MMKLQSAVGMLGAVLFSAQHNPPALMGAMHFRARGALRLIRFKSGKSGRSAAEQKRKGRQFTPRYCSGCAFVTEESSDVDQE